MDIELMSAILGRMTLINIAMLMLATLAVTLFRAPLIKIHSNLLKVGEQELLVLYMNYLANYKIAIIVFNLVPWIAVKMMGA